MNAKKLGVTVMLIGSLALGAVAANAQDTPPPDQPGQGQGMGDGGMGFGGGRPGQGGRPGGMGDERRGGGQSGERDFFLVQSVMDATGLNRIELGVELRGGSTLAEVITANGGSIEAVVADAVADATVEINTAVTNGRLTQEQADALIAQLEESYTHILNGEGRDQAMERVADVGIVRLAAEMTGLDAREIMQQVRGGTTLETVLTENGVEVAAFIAEATERAEARINVQVANDRLTAEEGAELLAQFTEELNSLLTEVMTPTL